MKICAALLGSHRTCCKGEVTLPHLRFARLPRRSAFANSNAEFATGETMDADRITPNGGTVEWAF